MSETHIILNTGCLVMILTTPSFVHTGCVNITFVISSMATIGETNLYKYKIIKICLHFTLCACIFYGWNVLTLKMLLHIRLYTFRYSGGNIIMLAYTLHSYTRVKLVGISKLSKHLRSQWTRGDYAARKRLYQCIQMGIIEILSLTF